MRVVLKTLKWFGITLGALVGLIVVALVIVYFVAGARINKTYAIEPITVPVPADPVSVERGKHLVDAIMGCKGCHGENLAGQVLLDDPVFGRFVPSNLTSGKGGIGGAYTDTDFFRAIRDGVRSNGKPLLLMPSHHYAKVDGQDMAAIIAYVKSVPPVDNELPNSTLGPLGRVLLVMGQVNDFLPVQLIDHAAPIPTAPKPGVTVEYGKYLALVCTACHGENLAGAQPSDPISPPAPNLTQGGDPGGWSEAGFINTIRTGITPTGRKLNPDFMPWEEFRNMTDDELKAVWLYLRSVPAVQAPVQ